MDIQTRTETSLIIQLTEAEMRAALADPADLVAAIRRAITPANGRRATSAVARRKKMPGTKRRGSARPKAKAMTCITCGKVYKRPNVFKAHVLKHTAGPVGAS